MLKRLKNTCAWSFLLITLAFVALPTGKSIIMKYLIPGDTKVTTDAVDTLVEQIRSGEDLDAAVEVFCETVLNGTK